MGACWIDKNSEFCKKYQRDMTKYKITGVYNYKIPSNLIFAEVNNYFDEQQKLPGWMQIGFNGCWSCENMSCNNNPMHPYSKSDVNNKNET